MNKYVIMLEYRDGDNEYTSKHIVKTELDKTLIETAINSILKDWWGEGTYEENEIHFNPQGYPSVEVISIDPYTTLKELERLIGTFPEF